MQFAVCAIRAVCLYEETAQSSFKQLAIYTHMQGPWPAAHCGNVRKCVAHAVEDLVTKVILLTNKSAKDTKAVTYFMSCSLFYELFPI